MPYHHILNDFACGDAFPLNCKHFVLVYISYLVYHEHGNHVLVLQNVFVNYVQYLEYALEYIVYLLIKLLLLVYLQNLVFLVKFKKPSNKYLFCVDTSVNLVHDYKIKFFFFCTTLVDDM